MSFIWPVMLFSLLVLPAGLLLYRSIQKRRAKLATQFGSMGFVTSGTNRPVRARQHVPMAFYFAGVGLLLVGLARPQAAVSLPRVEGTVMLLFDVSGSMAADDFEPTRLEAAKNVAREFVLSQPATVRVGVVAFSTSGFAVQPPSNNQEEILAAIDRLSPQQGTSLGQGILASLNAIAADAGQTPPDPANPSAPLDPAAVGNEPEIPAVIVMLTDGENNQAPDPVEVARAAAARGVQIHTVGVGSPQGALLKINGFTVHTRLDETMMRQVAEVSGGQYFAAEDEEELKRIYSDVIPQFVIRPEKIEVTALLAGASILVLLVGGMLSLLWFGRIL